MAYVAQEHGAAVTYLGAMGTRRRDIDKLLRTLQPESPQLIFVYGAGPCGSWLHRSLRKPGHGWGVAAPAWIPKKASDRVTPDRRDALPVARLMRSGALTPVYAPAVEDEAMRDLSRAREEALPDRKTATFRRKAFLRRHDIRPTGRATWGAAHLRWRSEVVCPTPAPQVVFQAYVRAVTDHTERLQRLERDLRQQVRAWRLCPVVEALQAPRGVQWAVAVTTVAARGDLTRVETPRPLVG